MKTILDRLRETPLRGLKQISVQVSRDWELCGKTRRRWVGSIESAEPVVALVLMATEDELIWDKSQKRRDNDGMHLLLSYENGPCHTNLAINLMAKGGVCQAWTKVITDDHFSTVPLERIIETGKISSFASVSGDPSLEMAIIFVAREDIRFYRHGIWHVCKRLRDDIGESLLAAILTRNYGIMRYSENEGFTMFQERYFTLKDIKE